MEVSSRPAEMMRAFAWLTFTASSVLSRVASPHRTLHPSASACCPASSSGRSEEHTSELQSLMRNSYAVFCLKKKTATTTTTSAEMLNNPIYTASHSIKFDN